MKNKIKEVESQPYLSLQENYDAVMEVVNCISKELCNPKTNTNTDDKLKKETKELIKKRGLMRAKCINTPNECIELAELNNVVRKKIRSNITQYEEEKITEELGNNLFIK